MQKANVPSSYRYQGEIQAMMFTFGEVRSSASETLQLVEDLLHFQAAEWVSLCLEVTMNELSLRSYR